MEITVKYKIDVHLRHATITDKELVYYQDEVPVRVMPLQTFFAFKQPELTNDHAAFVERAKREAELCWLRVGVDESVSWITTKDDPTVLTTQNFLRKGDGQRPNEQEAWAYFARPLVRKSRAR